jgi:hypothetical protein
LLVVPILLYEFRSILAVLLSCVFVGILINLLVVIHCIFLIFLII